MALSRLHTWIAGEILTASDLNAEFNNVIDNLSSSPMADGTLAAPGLAFDDDANTGFFRPGADQIEFVAGGATAFRLIRLVAGTAFAQFARRGSVGERFYPPLTFGNPDDGLASATGGTVDLVAGGRRVVQASAYALATNYLRVTPSQAGQPVIIDVEGADTNIPLLLRGKATGYVQASNYVLESFSATQSPTITGRMYWQTAEGSIHVSAGTLMARVPAITSIQAGDLIAVQTGATTYGRVQVGGATQYLGVSGGLPAYVDAYPKSRLNFGTPNNLASNSVNYLQVWGNSASEGVIERQYLPYAGRLKNIFVSAGSSPGAGQDYKITARVNGASVFSTITIGPGASEGSLTTETYHVSQFQFVTVQVTLSSTATTTGFSVTMEYDGANLQ